ncbi:hypothetical protein Glove_230g123 [Diversispora epigaea]|uniref:Uncharacterized protein n=1 Tax=Diversispora epigaea TaxID=1348612 RepID=A0A397IH94_9GLOM|nr:hypothetical protein Glove_230g123 [Diversispora epigaea]
MSNINDLETQDYDNAKIKMPTPKPLPKNSKKLDTNIKSGIIRKALEKIVMNVKIIGDLDILDAIKNTEAHQDPVMNLKICYIFNFL